MIEYQTLTMTKNQQLAFKMFMDFNILEKPELCMYAINEYFYEFKNLTEIEFIKIQEWENSHVPLNT